MPSFGFCGPGYELESVNTDAQRCVNMYLERDESGAGASQWTLVDRPGLRGFALPVTGGATVSVAQVYRPGLQTATITHCHVYPDPSPPPGQIRWFTDLSLSGSYTFLAGDSVTIVGMTGVTASYFNGTTQTIDAVGTGYIRFYLRPTVYGINEAETGTVEKVVPSKVYITTSAPHGFVVTNQVTFSQVSPATFLNGQTVTIDSVPTTTTFTAPFTHADYAGTAQTSGRVIAGSAGSVATVRAECEVNGSRFFALSGTTLWEISSNGTPTSRGTVTNDNKIAQIVKSPTQLLILSANKLYVFTLATNAFASVVNYSGGGAIEDVSKISYCNGYFVALLKDSQKVIVSGALAAQTWDANDYFSVTAFTENVLTLENVHGELWLQGPKRSVPYAFTGSDNIFDQSGPVIDEGSAAKDAGICLDNSLLWIGSDERGEGMAWRAAGYVPQRISTHAVENAWRKYSTISDAVGYGFQMNGHSFWVIYFPTANATWAYDCSTNTWSEWTHAGGTAHRSQCHVYCYGKHLVGDPLSGNIWDMSLAYSDDFGNNIERLRRSPYLNRELRRIYVGKFRLNVEVGNWTGVTDPTISLKRSTDGGHTWSSANTISFGTSADYNKKIEWRRLGSAEQMAFEVTFTAPIRLRITDAYVEAQ